MNKMLLEQLHRYTEDREIDYASAQYLGESFGIVWKSQQQLVEFKQAIDTYLKTFSLENFAIVESKVNVLTGKNTRSTEEAEQLTVFAAEPKTLRKPSQRKVLKGKKKINESVDDIRTKFSNLLNDAHWWYITSDESLIAIMTRESGQNKLSIYNTDTGRMIDKPHYGDRELLMNFAKNLSQNYLRGLGGSDKDEK